MVTRIAEEFGSKVWLNGEIEYTISDILQNAVIASSENAHFNHETRLERLCPDALLLWLRMPHLGDDAPEKPLERLLVPAHPHVIHQVDQPRLR